MLGTHWPLIATALLLAMPGPTNLLLAAAGSERGVRRGLGLLVVALLAYLAGMTALDILLDYWAAGAARQAMQGLAALCLLVMAARFWWPGRDAAPRPVGGWAMACVTLLNPKQFLIAALLIGAYPRPLALLLFAPMFLLAGGAYLWLGSRAQGRFGPKMRRLLGFALLLFALLAGASALRHASQSPPGTGVSPSTGST